MRLTKAQKRKLRRQRQKEIHQLRRGESRRRQIPDANSDSFLLSYEWRRVRMEVLKEQGGRCQCCGATASDGVRLHVDHILPRKKFPQFALLASNLQVLCEVCNHGKGNWDHTDWRPKHEQEWSPELQEAFDRWMKD